jgi:hypothetical protein
VRLVGVDVVDGVVGFVVLGLEEMVVMGSESPGTKTTRQTIDSSWERAAVINHSRAAVSSLVRLEGW